MNNDNEEESDENDIEEKSDDSETKSELKDAEDGKSSEIPKNDIKIKEI